MTDKIPTFSVVIPAYNASAFLPQTIESVQRQTFEDFEILIIDDGSTDDTLDIIKKYKETDSRIHFITQRNQGVSRARNTGIEAAEGKYIAFLDSDDIWMPNKLKIHFEHFQSDSKIGLSYARVEFIDWQGYSAHQYSNLRLKNVLPKHLYIENLICTPSNAVIVKDIFKSNEGFDGYLSGYADIELFLRISLLGWKVEGINQVLVMYRTSLSGMSSQIQEMEKEWEIYSERVSQYAPDLISNYYCQSKAFLLRYLARKCLRLKLCPSIGINLINRALTFDWKIVIRDPRRSILTILATYMRFPFSQIYSKPG